MYVCPSYLCHFWGRESASLMVCGGWHRNAAGDRSGWCCRAPVRLMVSRSQLKVATPRG